MLVRVPVVVFVDGVRHDVERQKALRLLRFDSSSLPWCGPRPPPHHLWGTSAGAISLNVYGESRGTSLRDSSARTGRRDSFSEPHVKVIVAEVMRHQRMMTCHRAVERTTEQLGPFLEIGREGHEVFRRHEAQLVAGGLVDKDLRLQRIELPIRLTLKKCTPMPPAG